MLDHSAASTTAASTEADLSGWIRENLARSNGPNPRLSLNDLSLRSNCSKGSKTMSITRRTLVGAATAIMVLPPTKPSRQTYAGGKSGELSDEG
jgi:hypothetical protein